MPLIRLRPLTAHRAVPTIVVNPGESKVVGRGASADISIDDISLSRQHMRLTMAGDGEVTAEDLGSTNGIFVNGARVSTARIAAGDQLTIGALEFLADNGTAPSRSVADAPAWGSMTRFAMAPDAHTKVDRRVLEALLATSRELMAFADLGVLLEHVLDRLTEILKPHRSAILFYDAGTGTLAPRAVRPAGEYASVSEFASATVVREAIDAREAVVLVDVRGDRRFQDAMSIMKAGARSIICVPLLGRTGPIGALYADRHGGAGFAPADVEYASGFAAHAATALETGKLYADREAHFRSTLEAFAKSIEARDRYTAGHSERVTAYTLALARFTGLDAPALEIIRRAGMLHDIGKVGIPDRVLQKPGHLDPDERAMMESHVTIGHEMLSGLPFLQESLPSIRGHHERWDGKGYPDALAGERIHLHARLMAVADTYDAMTSDRPYRAGLPADEAGRRIRAEPGKQFDPAVVEAFDRCEDEIIQIRAKMMAARQPAAGTRV
ncbi:MAG: HD domain-containing protein [Acidobacteriia bacterium]|nr:HD domain-containing protein [Terriglobia bacterium]